MGLFTKAPLDADFEQALHGDAAKTFRRAISDAQGLIRASLEADERLAFIFTNEYAYNRTLVFTNSRMLVFKCVSGFKSRVESLTYSCQPQDILKIAVGPTPDGRAYGAVIAIKQAPELILLKASTRRDAELIGHVAVALRDEGRL